MRVGMGRLSTAKARVESAVKDRDSNNDRMG